MNTYTFLELKNAAAHVLGGNPDSRISKGLIVNRAITHLCNAHPWTWRLAIADLNYVASQEWIALPADFGELVKLVGYGSKYTTVRGVSPEEIMGLRIHGITDMMFLGYCVMPAPQTDQTAAPAWRLEVAPTPAASQTGALKIMYRRQLPVFTTNDASSADDAKKPAIPPGQHDTLYALVRAYARSMEEEPLTAEWQVASQLLQRDIDSANRVTEPVLGYSRGTVVSEYQVEGELFRPFNVIEMPGE
jgi:hypothetical protein